MRLSAVALAACFSLAAAGSAIAVPLSGLFSVSAVNVTNLTSAQSQATSANFDAAVELATSSTGAFNDGDSDAVHDTFTYDGALDFRVGGSQNANYTVEQWLTTAGSGTVSGLSTALGDRQLSRSSIGNGTAETTFFIFTLLNAPAGDFTIQHDDGVAVFDDGVEIGFRRGPNGERTLNVNGFDGGTLQFLYVATNGNPSVLEVDIQPVPLPATLPLLLGAVGFLGWRARRRPAA
jgi:hypothetical protein